MSKNFTILDSGQRKQFESGMVRDITEGKIDYTLALDGPLFKRLAIHLTKGAIKYAKRNWMKAQGEQELERFRESALRHFLQWYWGETEEDHFAATVFNMNGVEYVKENLDKPKDVIKDISIPVTTVNCGACGDKLAFNKEKGQYLHEETGLFPCGPY